MGSCKEDPREEPYIWLPLEVTVTAYNSTPAQTLGHPLQAAWGDTLSDDIPSVAVSRDLLELGLDRNTLVFIEGVQDTFRILDKMNRRFRRHIDIFMGRDIKKAREWGRQKRIIWYRIDRNDTLKITKHEALHQP